MPRLCTLASVAFCVVAVSSSALAQHSMKPMSDEQAIKSAMEAAPPAVAKNATIMVANEHGEMRTVRKGTNGFTCIPDDPNSPGPDPMCVDANALAWVAALIGRKDPPAGKVGFMYMLRGGTDTSNTDPFATKPEPNNNWIETGSHVPIQLRTGVRNRAVAHGILNLTGFACFSRARFEADYANSMAWS